MDGVGEARLGAVGGRGGRLGRQVGKLSFICPALTDRSLLPLPLPLPRPTVDREERRKEDLSSLSSLPEQLNSARSREERTK